MFDYDDMGSSLGWLCAWGRVSWPLIRGCLLQASGIDLDITRVSSD